MAINFEDALGVHPNTLQFRTQRAKVLASNLANTDTPNFKARDISFEDAMNQVASEARTKHLAVVEHSNHMNCCIATHSSQHKMATQLNWALSKPNLRATQWILKPA